MLDLTDVAFTIVVDPGGYEIRQEEDHSDGEPLIWGRSSCRRLEETAEKVNPLTRSPFLLKELAGVNLDSDRAICEWHSRYGFLFEAPLRSRKMMHESGFFSNYLAPFREAVLIARAYVAFYEVWMDGRDAKPALFTTDSDLAGLLSEEDDPDRLEFTGAYYRDLFHLQQEGLWNYVPAGPDPEPLYDLSDYSKLAERILWQVIDTKINGSDTDTQYGPPGRVAIGTVMGEDRRFRRMALLPQNLYSAIWLQAAMILHRAEFVRTCPICSNIWTDPNPASQGRFHNSQVYCARRSCNVRASQKRREYVEEQALNTRKTAREIFVEVNSLGIGRAKEESVRRWVEAVRRG